MRSPVFGFTHLNVCLSIFNHTSMMKSLLILFSISTSLSLFSQFTYVPDGNFEQRLINLGLDDILDGQVLTSNINVVSSLIVSSSSISDLQGIEDFTALTLLSCGHNPLTSLDLSNNTLLTTLWCYASQLTCLNIANGNNTDIGWLSLGGNPNLTCIEVDDASWSTANWPEILEPQFSFSDNCDNECSTSDVGIHELNSSRILIKINDMMGRETKGAKNELLLYMYDDGSVDKKVVVK
jgi:hypothetical protein